MIFLFLDDNYSDVDSKIDVGGDTDDNNSGVHYMDDEGGASLAADSDREEEDPAKGSVGHQKTGDGHQHNNHSSDSGHSQQGNSSKRKKKTRTVFSRSQVIQSTLRLILKRKKKEGLVTCDRFNLQKKAQAVNSLFDAAYISLCNNAPL